MNGSAKTLTSRRQPATALDSTEGLIALQHRCSPVRDLYEAHLRFALEQLVSPSRPIPSLGAKTDGLFHRANFICNVDMYEMTVEEKVDWMSWPQPGLTERRLDTPIDAFPIAKALDRQIMVAVYSQWLFIVSLIVMAIVLFTRRSSKDRKPKGSDT
ncbi:MAG: hypothetical protein ACI8T1_000997 [Verrucomicrobiales bacterium]|jgi:hypothetical protein